MGLIVKYHTWVDGAVPAGLITALRLNTNFDNLYTLVNGLLDSANLVNPLPLTQTVLLNSGALLKFTETGGGSDYVALGAPPAIAASFTLKLPIADGVNGQVLQTDGAGQLAWASVLTGPPTDHGTLGGLDHDDHTQYSLYSFGTIAVAGQDNVVAELRADTLTLAAGANITITTVAATDTITIAGSTSIPAGVICMWHGLIANIPAGWTLCDGTAGTPDLRGKFVKGAAAATEAGATGGALTHAHDNHSAAVFQHTVTQAAAHTISAHAGATVANQSGAQVASGTGTVALTQAAHTVGQASAHTISAHSGCAVAGHGAQGHSDANHEPPYYVILFIMKTA